MRLYPPHSVPCLRPDVAFASYHVHLQLAMPSTDSACLFTSLNSKRPNTARKVHIRRLYDVLQLCIQRHDWVRAKRAWAILARCREVDWKVMWRTSVLLLGEGDPDTDVARADGDRIRFLSVMMRQHPDEVSRRELHPVKRNSGWSSVD